MNDGDHRDEIVRLEAQIDELAARIESCRKFILAGQIAVVGGGVVLIATVVGATRGSVLAARRSCRQVADARGRGHNFP